MAGVWAIFALAAGEAVPDPTPTTRLRLEDGEYVAHLSAMTVQHGSVELFEQKRAELGEDPLRADADPGALWAKVSGSARPIGQIIMDQGFFAGPGNIYRAEMLHAARVHPNIPGKHLTRSQFDDIWAAGVEQLGVGFAKGSIITVRPEDARALGKPDLRRYIYNRATCGRCDSRVLSWNMAGRTCYACPSCQPTTLGTEVKADLREGVVFNSHCARETLNARLAQGGARALTVPELRTILRERGEDFTGLKKDLVIKVEALALDGSAKGTGDLYNGSSPGKVPAAPAGDELAKDEFTTPERAAMEKALAGESRAVEHVAELAPEQAKRAVERATTPEAAVSDRIAKVRRRTPALRQDDSSSFHSPPGDRS